MCIIWKSLLLCKQMLNYCQKVNFFHEKFWRYG